MDLADVQQVDLEKRARELADEAERLREQSSQATKRDRQASRDLERALAAPLSTLRRIAGR